ncbi:MAG TPA: hypothetical protein VLR26_11470 [Frankiaceae bacterium]|nr:hypothetical protein [Frankiaceae bacterium]
MPDPSRLVVTPSLIADAGRQLSAFAGTLDRTAGHFGGPRPAPPLGDAGCTMAYLRAHHELAGLVTTAVVQGRSFAAALGDAAVLYEALDGDPRQAAA